MFTNEPHSKFLPRVYCISYCTIFPDYAVCSGLDSCVICHSHSVRAAVLSAVSINLKCRLMLLHDHMDTWTRTSTVPASARACSQCHSLGSYSSFRLPFPGYQEGVFHRSWLYAGFQNQTGTGDYMHRLLTEDVHWHTLEPTWHCWQRWDQLLLYPHLSEAYCTW